MIKALIMNSYVKYHAINRFGISFIESVATEKQFQDKIDTIHTSSGEERDKLYQLLVKYKCVLMRDLGVINHMYMTSS